MKKYRNKYTGEIIEVTSTISGGIWELIPDAALEDVTLSTAQDEPLPDAALEDVTLSTAQDEPLPDAALEDMVPKKPKTRKRGTGK